MRRRVLGAEPVELRQRLGAALRSGQRAGLEQPPVEVAGRRRNRRQGGQRAGGQLGVEQRLGAPDELRRRQPELPLARAAVGRHDVDHAQLRALDRELDEQPPSGVGERPAVAPGEADLPGQPLELERLRRRQAGAAGRGDARLGEGGVAALPGERGEPDPGAGGERRLRVARDQLLERGAGGAGVAERGRRVGEHREAPVVEPGRPDRVGEQAFGERRLFVGVGEQAELQAGERGLGRGPAEARFERGPGGVESLSARELSGAGGRIVGAGEGGRLEGRRRRGGAFGGVVAARVAASALAASARPTTDPVRPPLRIPPGTLGYIPSARGSPPARLRTSSCWK